MLLPYPAVFSLLHWAFTNIFVCHFLLPPFRTVTGYSCMEEAAPPAQWPYNSPNCMYTEVDHRHFEVYGTDSCADPDSRSLQHVPPEISTWSKTSAQMLYMITYVHHTVPRRNLISNLSYLSARPRVWPEDSLFDLRQPHAGL